MNGERVRQILDGEVDRVEAVTSSSLAARRALRRTTRPRRGASTPTASVVVPTGPNQEGGERAARTHRQRGSGREGHRLVLRAAFRDERSAGGRRAGRNAGELPAERRSAARRGR